MTIRERHGIQSAKKTDANLSGNQPIMVLDAAEGVIISIVEKGSSLLTVDEARLFAKMIEDAAYRVEAT